jgi:hypothetical protein
MIAHKKGEFKGKWEIPLLTNAIGGSRVADEAGGLKFFCKKNFNRLCTKIKLKEKILQRVHYTNQTKSIITATPVAFLLFAKMQTPRPSATPLLHSQQGGRNPLAFTILKFIIHNSPFTIHNSPFITHHSKVHHS